MNALSIIRRLVVINGLLLITILVCVTGALAWRLRQGPLPLPLLDSYVRQALAGAGPDLLFEFDGTVLAWEPSRNLPEIRVVGARLMRADRKPVAVFPELALGPSLRAFLRGRLAVGWIGLPGIRLTLSRDPRGQLALGTAQRSGDPAGEVSPALQALLSAPAGPGSPTSFLDRIHIRDAEVILDDLPSASAWKATKTNLDIRRGPAGIEASLGADLVVRGGPGSLRLPIVATATATLDGSGGIAGIDFAATARRGSVETVGDSAHAVPLGGVEVQGNLSTESKTLEIQKLHLRVGAATVAAKMALAFGENAPGFRAEGELTGLPASDVELVWPSNVAPAARHWVRSNVRDGNVVTTRFAIRLPAGVRKQPPAEDTVHLDFTFAGLTVDYFRPLRPLVGVGGSATLNQDGLDVRVDTGDIGTLHVGNGTMHMDFTGKPGSASIAVDVEGPGEELLALLDEAPLGYPSRFGISPQAVAASSRTHAEFRFPLVAQLTPDQLEVSAKTSFEGAGLDASVVTTVAGGAIQNLTLEHLRYETNDLSAAALQQPDGRYRISVSGPSIDLRPIRDRMAKGGAAPSPGRPYDLDFDFARGVVAKNLEVSNLRGRIRNDGEKLQGLEATGTVGGNGTLRASLRAAPRGRRLEFSSKPAGEVLRGLGVFENAAGGSLSLSATLPDEEGDGVQGMLELKDFRVTEAPVLARVLTLGSLDGIGDMVTGGEGILFTRSRFPFRWSRGTITVTDGRAVGSIGLTADGVIDRAKDHIDIAGEIIPAYTLNSALGKIPLIGDLLVGSKGGGVFGIEYKVVGTLQKPEVRANPLSALSPKTLREVFVDPFVRAAENATGPASP